MSYERRPIKGLYNGLGPVRYDGFAFDIADQEYLLEWNNTIVWEFADSCYDHIEIATASLQRIVDQELVDDHELDGENIALFLVEDERHQQLADDLVAEGFPHYYQPHPDPLTYECFIALSTNLGQQMIEAWLSQNH